MERDESSKDWLQRRLNAQASQHLEGDPARFRNGGFSKMSSERVATLEAQRGFIGAQPLRIHHHSLTKNKTKHKTLS